VSTNWNGLDGDKSILNGRDRCDRSTRSSRDGNCGSNGEATKETKVVSEIEVE
jgi:hypothetical protein